MILEFLHNHLVGQNIPALTMLLYFVTVFFRIDNYGKANLLYPIHELKSHFDRSDSSKDKAKVFTTLTYVVLISLLVYETTVNTSKSIMDVYWIAIIIIYNIAALVSWIITNIKTNKAKIFLSLLIIVLIETVLLFIFKHTWH